MESNYIVEVLAPSDSKRWNDLLYNTFLGSYRAGILYEHLKSSLGREVTTFVFHKGEGDLGGAHYSLKRGFGNLVKTADIMSGVVMRGEPNPSLLEYILNHFSNWAQGRKASIARVNPWLPTLVGGKVPEYVNLLVDSMYNNGFTPLKEGSHTYWIDLTLDESQLLKNMRSSTRRNIIRGYKAGIKTEVITTPDQPVIELFWELYSALGKRKGFKMLPEKRFRQEIQTLVESKQAVLFVTSFKEVVINIALASRFGLATYFHGAINPEYHSLEGCPSPGQIAQWEIIKYAKSEGLTLYDLAFCPGAVPEKDHPDINMWRFKYGFGGKHVQYMPVYGKILRPFTGGLFRYLRYRK